MTIDEQAPDERIVKKIQAILAKAKCPGSTENEREIAIKSAYALMAKYNLTMESVNDEVNPRLSTEVEGHGMAWAREIASAVAHLFFCKYVYADSWVEKKKKNWEGKEYSYWDKKINVAKHQFIGRKSNSVTASELSQYLINSIFREGSRRMKKECPAKPYQWRMDFAKGAASEILYRCIVMRQEREAENKQEVASGGTDIVLASFYKQELESNMAWIEKHIGKLGKGGSGSTGVANHQAHEAGAEFGKNLPLAAGITDNSKKALRLEKK